MPIFAQPEQYKKIPFLVSDKIHELLYEREHSGVETTPDETSNLIEVFYKYLVRVWVCETLYLGSTTPTLFDGSQRSGRDILRLLSDELLSPGRKTIGKWVSLAREMRNFFKEQKCSTFTKGLLDLDFGKNSRAKNRTARLLTFRNEFAHGAFAAPEKEIKHYPPREM